MLYLKASLKGSKVFLPPKCTTEATVPKRQTVTINQNQTVGGQHHLTRKVLPELKEEKPPDMY